MRTGSEMIDLRRITSPQLPNTRQILESTMQDLNIGWDVAQEMRQHRRRGTEADLAAAVTYLALGTRSSILTDRIFLANGTWNVLFLLFETFVGRGGSVAVEASTYTQVRDVARILGIRLVPIAMDDDGLLPEKFEEACVANAPKLLYCVPNAQNPTASILPLERRARIADIARRHDVLIVEDDPQGLIRQDFPPGFSQIAPDISWAVMGLSKSFFIGARVAYVIAPNSAAVEHVMARFGTMAMWYVSAPSAAFVTRAIENGAANTILDEIRRETSRRRKLAQDIIPRKNLVGMGASHLWLRSDAMSGDDLARSASSQGVLIRSGSEFVVDKNCRTDGVRVSLVDASFDEVEDGLLRLTRILQA